MDNFAVIALAVAALLAIAAWLLGSRSSGVAAGAWGAYAAYEHAMALRILCSGECNIRIDLLVIWPFLVVVTLIVLWRMARRMRHGVR
jgi:hypothetical protein